MMNSNYWIFSPQTFEKVCWYFGFWNIFRSTPSSLLENRKLLYIFISVISLGEPCSTVGCWVSVRSVYLKDLHVFCLGLEMWYLNLDVCVWLCVMLINTYINSIYVFGKSALQMSSLTFYKKHFRKCSILKDIFSFFHVFLES